jgi:two-component system LytT family response regulator
LPSNFKFSVIFTTSFSEYALQAIKVAAVDYLLKPYGLSELREAMELFEKKYQDNLPNLQVYNLMKNLREPHMGQHKIGLPTPGGYVFVRVDDIVRCMADGPYTTLHLIGRRQIMISRTLKDVGELLDSYNFFRIHQSHLINMSYINEFRRSDGTISMDDGTVLDVSRRKKEDFIDRFKRM